MQLDRWVTYIYRYCDSKRCENIGFIKAQKIKNQTNDMARFQIGIKLYKVKPCKCMTYLLDDDDQIYHVKDFYFSEKEHDTMMLRFEIPWRSPVGKDKIITDYMGLYFMCDDGEYYVGLWQKHEFAQSRIRSSANESSDEKKEQGTCRRSANVYKQPNDENIRRWQPPALENTFQNMLESYPKLPQFAESNLVECVKIMPQDIGKLPIGNWKLGTNSFVTHGFYHYQYLMFGRVRFDQDERLVIGIPGVFTSKEKYVANMFGFAMFVPAQPSDYLTGRFGYWVSEVVSE